MLTACDFDSTASICPGGPIWCFLGGTQSFSSTVVFGMDIIAVTALRAPRPMPPIGLRSAQTIALAIDANRMPCEELAGSSR